MGKNSGAKSELLDPNNGIALRTYLESLRGQMIGVRAMWDAQYSQLRAFFAPRNGRVDPTDVNNGQRQDFQIINETGILALRVLASGMLTGMSSQTRKWFKMKTGRKDMDENQDVRVWCESIDDIVRDTLLKSNYYQTLLEAYESEGLYGTTAFTIEADKKTDINCRMYPNGSFWLGNDDTLRVDLCIRTMDMTARNIVEKFGYDNCSSAIQTYYDSNAGGVQETYYPVVHVIHKGDYYGPPKKGQPKWPWMSIWYEMSSFNDKMGLLRVGGFQENPLIAGRWRTIGENIYGESPAMDVLGSCMSLQCWEERLAQAAEKQFNPPMIANSAIDPRRLTTLPGEFSFVDMEDVSKAFAPAYAIDFKLADGEAKVRAIEQRINEGMFKTLFQMFSDSDRREITAEEIRARQQEKMQVLGPVVERNVQEILAPSIMRVLSILQRIPGKLPPAPQELRDQQGNIVVPLKLEFESILAAAQRMVGLNNINQVMQFAGQEAALDQNILDNFDLDKVARKVASLAGMDADLERPMEEMQKMRADRQHAQQQQMMAENSQKLAMAANVASKTPAGAGTLLDKVAPGLAGGGSG